MIHKVDLRGLNCPEPVLQTKKLFDNPKIKEIQALVEDDVCVMNLERLSHSLHASFAVRQLKEGFEVTIRRKKGKVATVKRTHLANKKDQAIKATDSSDLRSNPVIFLTKDTFGDGDRDLSQTLVNLFLQTALEAGHLPQAILMANSGVKLMALNSPCLKVLNEFKERGCSVLACGLCLEYYGLKDQVAKEQITTMFAICEYLFATNKIISL